MKLAVFITRPGPRADRLPRGQGLDENAALQQGLPPRVDPTRERQMWDGISEIELEGSSDEELQYLCNSRKPLIPINQAL